MPDDRELLQAAARAAGINLLYFEGHPFFADSKLGNEWRPLEDSGQALELAVKLGIEPCWYAKSGYASARAVPPSGNVIHIREFGTDPMAATRRAIVRAAASMAPAEEG